MCSCAQRHPARSHNSASETSADRQDPAPSRYKPDEMRKEMACAALNVPGECNRGSIRQLAPVLLYRRVRCNRPNGSRLEFGGIGRRIGRASTDGGWFSMPLNNGSEPAVIL